MAEPETSPGADELADLRQELWVARDALIGAEAQNAVLAARVAELEHQNAALEAGSQALDRLVPKLAELKNSAAWQRTGQARQVAFRVLRR